MATATATLVFRMCQTAKGAAIATANVRDFMPAIVSLLKLGQAFPPVVSKFPPLPSGHGIPPEQVLKGPSARDLVPCRNRALAFANPSNRQSGFVKTGTGNPKQLTPAAR